MNRMAAALIAVTMLVVPAAASAQSTTPAPAPPPTTSGAPAPAPAPAKGRLKLTLQRVGSGGVLAGSRWVVRGRTPRACSSHSTAHCSPNAAPIA